MCPGPVNPFVVHSLRWTEYGDTDILLQELTESQISGYTGYREETDLKVFATAHVMRTVRRPIVSENDGSWIRQSKSGSMPNLRWGINMAIKRLCWVIMLALCLSISATMTDVTPVYGDRGECMARCDEGYSGCKANCGQLQGRAEKQKCVARCGRTRDRCKSACGPARGR